MHCLWIVFVCSLAQLSSWRWGNDDIDILGRGKSVSGLPNDFFWTSDRTRFHGFASRSLWSLKSPVTSNTCTNSLFPLFFRLCRAAVVAGGRESKCTWQILTTQFSATKGKYAANDTNLNMIGRIQQKAPTSPPLSMFNVSSNPESSLTQKSLGRWSVVPNFPLSRSQSGISSRSLNWTAYLTCIEGVFSNWLCNPYPQNDLKKLPPQTSTFPCEAIHPGVDLPSLPNQIFFEKIS